MSDTYRVFKRSCKSFEEMVSANKITLRKGLSLEEARAFCHKFNSERNADQIRKGTKAEFTAE